MIRFDHLSKVVKAFWGGRRGTTEGPNGAKFCRHVKETWMNQQSHFEPKPTLRASSAFAARPHFAVLEGLLPMVGSTPSLPSFLMSSHFLGICTGSYGVRPVRYRFDHLLNLKVVKGPFWGRLARRNGGSKWCQTLQTCGEELEGHTQIFWTESEALCLFHTRQLTPK